MTKRLIGMLAAAVAAGLLAIPTAEAYPDARVEAQTRPDFGLLLQPPGMRVLQELGLLERVLALGQPVTRLLGHAESGRRVMDIRYDRWTPGGFGLGLRTKILGYFIRVDYAWGIDNRKVQDGRWYLSLALDF